MDKTINLKAEILPDRELTITLPDDVPPGPAEILLIVSSPDRKPGSTLGDLANSEFIGIWRDRADISDSGQFARSLRSDSWKRSP